MAVFDIIPTTGRITGNDIRDTLAAGGGSVNNDARTWFKPEAKINMWSKYKPVDYAQENTELFPNWWKANDGNCGIEVPTSDGDPDLLKNILSYVLPKNGSAKRWSDFRGYLKNAQIPFSISFPSSVIVGVDLKVQLHTLSSTTNNLGFEDIYTGVTYFGVCVRYGSEYLFKTAEISGNEARVSLQDCPVIIFPREIELIGFITRRAIPDWTAYTLQTMYSLNAKDKYSFVSVPTKIPGVDTHWLFISIAEPVDRRKIELIGDASLAGGLITINGRVNEYLTNSYILKSVLVRAVNKDTGIEVASENRPIDGNSSPKHLDKNELVPPFNLIFAATFNDPVVPRDNNQVYNFYYSLVYDK